MFPGGEIRTQIIMGNPQTTSPFRNVYSGLNEVPPNNSTATGMIIGSYNHATNTISYSIQFSGLTAGTTAAHFHGPVLPGTNAPIQVAHTGFPTGVTSGFFSSSHVLTDAFETQLLSGLWYSNIHTSFRPGGEIRTQVQVQDILPPVITDPAAHPSMLWPPNHKMRSVGLNYSSSDNFPAAVTCALSVVSDEPVTSEGDLTAPDWTVESTAGVKLRSERAGDGDGRLYTITVTCTDAQGNISSKSATVSVPHDMGNRSIPTTGGSELAPGFSVTVLQNPVNNAFRFCIYNDAPEQRVSMVLYDLMGRVVQRKELQAAETVVQMGEKAGTGMYLLMVQRGKERKVLNVVKR
jgi:hypothetical protein